MIEMNMRKVLEQGHRARREWIASLDEKQVALFGKELLGFEPDMIWMVPRFNRLFRDLAEYRPVLALRFIEVFGEFWGDSEYLRNLNAAVCRLPDHCRAFSALQMAQDSGEVVRDKSGRWVEAVEGRSDVLEDERETGSRPES